MVNRLKSVEHRGEAFLVFEEMDSWLNEHLKEEIKKILEPRYKRILSDEEVIEIADNLSTVVEGILKLKWRQKYEKTI